MSVLLNTNGFVSPLKFPMTVTVSGKKFKDTCRLFGIILIGMHNESMNLNNAALLSFNAADIANKINHGLRSVFPSWSSFKNGLYILIILVLFVLRILLFLTILIKLAFNNINVLAAKIHGLKLKMDPHTESLI